ncbi:hypothetical protein N7462_009070 [Penicillium macrosclerotiorum]|uniref:uncharacterized protein n=1 Tax=Penicillium macrosclerotiorum TaxID=303699 RepID=UPI002546B002|nr:uncharacterized protein N7462_009070 [Penicillium macrosclerotiorum]KAJ5676173.1 hypothetical protein N7462_009070 [Penicillium macrosclerotiorum]
MHLIAALSILAAAYAATVEPVQVQGGCSSLPAYDASTGMAGPWVVEVNQCVNTTAADHSCTMEGFGSTSVYFLQQGDTSVQRGFIAIVSENDLAKSPLRCNDATTSFESYVPSGVSGYQWKSVNITDMPYSAQLMWGLGQYSLPIQAYNHYVSGVKQEGIFLGAHNVTTWGVQLQSGSAGSGGKPYWLVRLLGPGSADPQTGDALLDGEFRTFIKIDST